MSAFDLEAEQLQRALALARARWEEASSLWRDDVQRAFAEQHWSPLEEATRAVIDGLEALSSVVVDSERD